MVVYDELEVTQLAGRLSYRVTTGHDLASARFLGIGRDILGVLLFDDGRLGHLGSLLSLPLKLQSLFFKFLFLLVKGFDVGGEQSFTGLDFLLIFQEYFTMSLHRLI